MAYRVLSRRVAALSVRSAPTFAARRAAATAAATSNLPDEVLLSIEKEARLNNADPSADSQTARLVNDQLPYMVPTYVRPPPMFNRGSGCYLWDVENRRYLDFTAGIAVNALGHCDPQITNLIYHQVPLHLRSALDETQANDPQAGTLMHTSNLYHNPWTGSLSKLLVEATRASGGMHDASRVFICNSGSEANEAAIKFARKMGKTLDPSGAKHGIVSFQNSFHGRTMGSLSATPNPKYQAPFGPMVPGFTYGAYNDVAGLDALITDTTCGVIVEPIQGEGGVNVATPEFLAALRARCTAVGAVLIYDEIQSGLGRTGMLWAHGAHPASSHPDILCTAKALGNGYPIGATIVTERMADAIVTGDHGTTFGGNPLACRIAHHIVERLADPALHTAVAQRGARFRKHFERLRRRFPDVVQEVRGKGLILGLQLAQDPSPVVTAARERGLLVITCGTNTLRFVPPLVISEKEVDAGMAILEEAMAVVFKTHEHVRPTKGQEEMQDS